MRNLHKPLINFRMPHELGVFGAERTHDIHTGIDLYCDEFDYVFAIDHGKVIEVNYFTGPECNTPWWHTTYCIVIEHKDLNSFVLYGEVIPFVREGDTINKGQIIGQVTKVLRKDKGLPSCMLHLEQYIDHYQPGEHADWPYPRKENTNPNLIDPMNLITKSLVSEFLSTQKFSEDQIDIFRILGKIYDSYPYSFSPPKNFEYPNQEFISWSSKSLTLNVHIFFESNFFLEVIGKQSNAKIFDKNISTQNNHDIKFLFNCIHEISRENNTIEEYEIYKADKLKREDNVKKEWNIFL